MRVFIIRIKHLKTNCAKGNLSLYSYAKKERLTFRNVENLLLHIVNEKEQLLKIKKHEEENNVKL